MNDNPHHDPATSPYLVYVAIPPAVAQTVEFSLNPARYTLVFYPDPPSLDEALEHGCPDLLLLHLGFAPPDDYANIIATFRRTCPVDGAPVLALTSEDNSENLLAVFRAGTSDYLNLPINQGMLLLRLERLLLKARVRTAASSTPSHPGSRHVTPTRLTSDPWNFEIERARRYGTPLTVVEFEWEPMPNDQENVASLISHRLDGKARKSDRIVPVSDHQLAVLLPGATEKQGKAAAAHLQHSVRAALEQVIGESLNGRWRGGRILELPFDYQGKADDLIRLLRLKPIEEHIEPPSFAPIRRQ